MHQIHVRFYTFASFPINIAKKSSILSQIGWSVQYVYEQPQQEIDSGCPQDILLLLLRTDSALLRHYMVLLKAYQASLHRTFSEKQEFSVKLCEWIFIDLLPGINSLDYGSRLGPWQIAVESKQVLGMPHVFLLPLLFIFLNRNSYHLLCFTPAPLKYNDAL